MSTLVVDELYDGTTFAQKFKLPRHTSVAHIRPWIVKWGTIADGDFTCEIYQDDVLLASSTISYTEVNAQITDDYFHGYIRFDFNGATLNIPEGETEDEYEVRFYMDNHTTDANNFVGIVRNWDIQYYEVYGNVSSGEPVNDMIAPAGLEIYEYRSL